MRAVASLPGVDKLKTAREKRRLEVVFAQEDSTVSKENDAPFHITTVPYPSTPDNAVYQGVAGDIVHAIEPHSEADPMALLVQTLVAFGNVVGRTAYAMAEADKHFTNEYVALVGETSKGRKGTSWGHVRKLFEAVDPDWTKGKIQSGLSSGEGLIWAVRDPISKSEPIREKKQVTGYQEIETDPGVLDKRLLVYESELANVLRVVQRDGNTLSAILRNGYDGQILAALTKNSPAKASGAHISIIGHITRDELQRYMDRTELANGLANRFLWIATKRSRELPDGGGEVDYAPFTRRLKDAITFAKQAGEVKRDKEASAIWNRVYGQLSDGKPGIFGAATARAEAHVMRVSVLYALLDQSKTVRKEHLKAALALWEYAEATAKWVWGDAMGDEIADTLTSALRDAGEAGMTRTQIWNLFEQHITKSKLEKSLALLLEKNIVRRESSKTAGRPIEKWFLVAEKAEKAEKGP